MNKCIKTLFTLLLFLVMGCSKFNVEIPKVESNKYKISMKQLSSTAVPEIYINAHNVAGGVNISVPSSEDGGNAQNIFINNENIKLFLEKFLISNPQILESIKDVNYVDFQSNENLKLSYQQDNNQELLIPDMLSKDGSLNNGLKYRKTFDKIYFRLTETFSRFFKIPFFGELPAKYAFTHRNVNDRMLIYADYEALNGFVDMLSGFNINKEMIDMMKSLLNQYNTSADTLEVGIYLEYYK